MSATQRLVTQHLDRLFKSTGFFSSLGETAECRQRGWFWQFAELYKNRLYKSTEMMSANNNNSKVVYTMAIKLMDTSHTNHYDYNLT